MTGRTYDGSYYAEAGIVWKAPIRTPNADGTTCISIGFPVCTMHEAVGAGTAETVAKLMNAGEAVNRGEADGRALDELSEAIGSEANNEIARIRAALNLPPYSREGGGPDVSEVVTKLRAALIECCNWFARADDDYLNGEGRPLGENGWTDGEAIFGRARDIIRNGGSNG